MKKKLIFGDLSGVEKRSRQMNSAQIMAFRQGDKVHVSNFDSDEGRVSISFDKGKEELVLRLKLRNNDYVALGDANGIAEKRQFEPDPNL